MVLFLFIINLILFWCTTLQHRLKIIPLRKKTPSNLKLFPIPNWKWKFICYYSNVKSSYEYNQRLVNKSEWISSKYRKSWCSISCIQIGIPHTCPAIIMLYTPNRSWLYFAYMHEAVHFIDIEYWKHNGVRDIFESVFFQTKQTLSQTA